MATSVEDKLNLLFSMINDAKTSLMNQDKCTIERDKALDLLDDIQAQMPVELAEAKKITNARDEYLAAARREADDIKKRAEAEAERMVESDRIVLLAKERSKSIQQEAEENSRKLKRVVNDYCEDLLHRTEEAIADAYKELQTAHAQFRAVNGSAAGQDSGTTRVVFDAEAEG